MATVSVDRMTRRRAMQRRKQIIDAVGGNEHAFLERADEFLLDARELALYDELNGLDYLLGE